MNSPAADPRAPYVRLAVVGLVYREERSEGRWLLLHRQGAAGSPPAAWDPPGGRLEGGEDLGEAVTREVFEETGLAVESAGPCYAFLTYYKGERLLAVSMACRPRGSLDDLRLEPGGAAAWRWSTAREWEELARAGRSSWSPQDVSRATSTAVVLLKREA